MMHEVPGFAVIGRVNSGKSSVLATLLEEDDNRVIPISETPGETTKNQWFDLEVNGTTLVRFIDTPGFQQPLEVRQRLLARYAASNPLKADTNSTPDRACLQRFIVECQDEFPDECELLAPLLAGAGAIYVIDPDWPVRDDFLAEIELLRWTGCPRMALINRRQAGVSGSEEGLWRQQLAMRFNLVRTFNAHQAQFSARKALLRSLVSIDERHADGIEKTLTALDTQWQQRRYQAAETLLETLIRVAKHKESGEFERDNESEKQRLASRLEAAYIRYVDEQVNAACRRLLHIYQHHSLGIARFSAAQTLVDTHIDWHSRETWRRFGLTRKQLTVAAASAGALAGVAIDAGLGGASLGIGALTGALLGGVSTYRWGDSLPSFSINVGGLKAGNRNTLLLAAPADANFEWILLDRLLLCFRETLRHTHGRRDVSELTLTASAASSITRTLSAEQQRTLMAFFKACRKGDNELNEGAMLNALLAILTTLEGAI